MDRLKTVFVNAYVRFRAGLEVKPGVWFYHAQTLAQFLAEREKYKPISMNGD